MRRDQQIPDKPTGLLEPAGLLAIVEAQAGNKSALEFVLQALQGPLHDHALFILKEENAADDALQDALISIARSIHQLRNPRLIQAWAYRIVHRAAIREFARRSRVSKEVPLDLAIEIAAPDGGENPIDSVLGEGLEQAVSELPVGCGTAMRLRYIQELSLAEVATVLDVPMGTVKSRLNYGLTLLRQRLASQ